MASNYIVQGFFFLKIEFFLADIVGNLPEIFCINET